jgi:hypothetical protein
VSFSNTTPLCTSTPANSRAILNKVGEGTRIFLKSSAKVVNLKISGVQIDQGQGSYIKIQERKLT